ncbi:MAG: M3 family metallopeptidase [Parabacteroides sp.]
MTSTNDNPFLSVYNTPFGTPPFDQIRIEHYEPAFKEGIRRQQLEIESIVQNPSLPTFDNTLVALERSGELLSRVSGVFYNILHADADDAMMELSQRISPLLSDHANNIYLNRRLFERVKYVYDQRNELSLSVEEAKLLEETYSNFKDQGATLNETDQEHYRSLSNELSLLTLQFDQNALKDKNRYELLIQEERQLEGLPETIREAARIRAEEKGYTGWLFNLSAPSYGPFMKYISDRRLREQMYRAFMSIGSKGDEYDNQEIIRKIVNIRLEIAHLMGFPSFADYQLEHTMAQRPEQVYQLLNQLQAAYKPVAQEEYHTLAAFAKGWERQAIQLQPWDWNYYAEQLKHLTFDLNDEMTRPYFELGHVCKSVFGLATQLYGITFRHNTQIPVYHPEVKAYEVYDRDGSFLAILYTDFFPRDGKQSGAWMNDIKPQYRTKDGTDERPQIVIVMNFTRPTADKPSLLTFDEVNTLLHEFGHALHGLFAKGTFASLSGTNVYRDFVELPSQLMENWLTEREFLHQIAIHYQTGETMPESMIQKLLDAANFQTGYLCCRQLSFGLLDMAWHTLTRPFDGDVSTFEKSAWQSVQILPEVEGALMSCHFGHIFSGGYAAGYYGYKWAEVLDADAFSLFQEKGIFDQETAQSFRDQILSKGGSEHPTILYKRFRGKEPTIDALLKRNGVKK